MTVPEIRATAPTGPDRAPLLVLGPSLGTSTIVWERALPLLAMRFRVSAWDLPGHGASPASIDAFTIADLADAVAATYDEPFLYAGVSIGGAVGLELALRHKNSVRAISTVCSGARIGAEAAWRDRAAQVRAQGTASLVSASAGRWFAHDTIARDPDLTGRLLHALRDADDESYARCSEALAAFDARSRLSSIEAPCIALWGEYDAVTPGELSETIASGVQHGEAACVAGASHLATVDAPEDTSRLLEAFFSHRLLEGTR